MTASHFAVVALSFRDDSALEVGSCYPAFFPRRFGQMQASCLKMEYSVHGLMHMQACWLLTLSKYTVFHMQALIREGVSSDARELKDCQLTGSCSTSENIRTLNSNSTYNLPSGLFSHYLTALGAHLILSHVKSPISRRPPKIWRKAVSIECQHLRSRVDPKLSLDECPTWRSNRMEGREKWSVSRKKL